MINVKMPDGKEFQLKDGEHNLIQQQVITEFLPRFGYGARCFIVETQTTNMVS